MYQPQSFFAPSIGQPGLSIFVEAGTILISGESMEFSAQSFSLAANSTSYVFLNTSIPAITSNSSGFPSTNCYPIATVITGTNTVASCVDARPDVGGTGGGVGAVSSVFGRTGAVTAEANDYSSVPDLTLGDGSGAALEFFTGTTTNISNPSGTAELAIVNAGWSELSSATGSLILGSASGQGNFQLENSAGSAIIENPTTGNGDTLNISCGGNGGSLNFTVGAGGGKMTVADPVGSLWGSATGGSQGAGTINAQGLYVNGVAVGVPSGSTNLVYATPNGSSGNASLRALVSADLPANPSTPSGSGFFGGFRLGQILPNGSIAAAGILYAANPGDLVAILFYLDQAITITHITVSVTAANGSATTFDAGLYTAAGTLVANTAGFNGNSATVQRIAVVQGSGSVTLTPGWYYYAYCTEGSSTTSMRANRLVYNNSDNNSWTIMNGGSAPVFGYKAQASGNSWNSTGILPSTLPTLTAASCNPIVVYFSA